MTRITKWGFLYGLQRIKPLLQHIPTAYLVSASAWYHMLDFSSNLLLCVIISSQFVMFQQHQCMLQSDSGSVCTPCYESGQSVAV